MQLLEPACVAKRPTAHEEQRVDPTLTWYLFAGHGTQLTDASKAAAKPAAQAVQLVAAMVAA